MVVAYLIEVMTKLKLGESPGQVVNALAAVNGALQATGFESRRQDPANSAIIDQTPQ